MPDLDVRASGEHTYDVTVTADDGTRESSAMTVPPEYLETVSGPGTDEATVARAALDLLLARGSSPLPRRFSLDEVERSSPGFDDQLRAAVQP